MRRPSTSINAIRIQNYKNIIDTGEVELTDVVALLGKNEAGKSSILEAVEYLGNEESVPTSALPLDKRREMSAENIEIATAKVRLTRDIAKEAYSLPESELENISFPVEFEITKFADGTRAFSSELIDVDHVDRINEMATEVAESRTMAESILQAENNDPSDPINDIIDELISIHDRSYDIGNPSDVSEILERAERTVELSEQTDLDKGNRKNVLDGIKEHVENAKTEVTPPDPNILYYKNYTLISDEYDINSDDRETTFANMLSVGGFSVEKYKEAVEKERYLDDISREIEAQINRAWSQKEIRISIRRDGDSTLLLYIRDVTASDHKEVDRSLTKPSERSDGFRWFFSFFVDILAQADDDGLEEKILLFDDPAIRLHPEGKRDWLETVVNEVGRSDQVIYTAHSPYLIDKDRPTRIRIVKDTQDMGTIIQHDVLDPQAEPDSLEPLRNALGINLGDSPFLSKKTVLVEGPSDYYILTGVLNYFREYTNRAHFNSEKITINPSNGANQMPALASWLSSQNIDFAMVLDSDSEGQNVYEKVENNRFLGVEPRNVTMLTKSGKTEDVVIEDMFPPEFYLNSFNVVLNNIADDVGTNYRNLTAVEEGNEYRIGVKQLGQSGWETGPVQYDGTGLDDVLEDVIEQQPIADEIRSDDGSVQLFKRQVAENIHTRLSKGDPSTESLSNFNRLLGEIGSTLDL